MISSALFAMIVACSCAFPYSCLISSSRTNALITEHASLISCAPTSVRTNIFLSFSKILVSKIFCLFNSCFMQHSRIQRSKHCNVAVSQCLSKILINKIFLSYLETRDECLKIEIRSSYDINFLPSITIAIIKGISLLQISLSVFFELLQI